MEKKVNLFRLSILLLFAVTLPLVFSCTNDLVPGDPDLQELRPTMIDPWTAIDQSPYVKKSNTYNPVTLMAGHGGTKSTMVMNSANDYASVVWSPNDEFKMYAYSGGFYSRLFKTDAGGESAVFTSNHVEVSGTPQHSIFAPVGGINLGYDGSVFFGLNIPTTQTAVANKVNDKYLFSYAQSVHQTDNLTFKNILSLVRFKMSGSIASSVTQVTLTGASPIGGDFIIVPASDGTPAISLSKSFSGATSSASITLTGTFAADTYYYFAVIPGVQTGFSMVFSDGTKSTTKVSSKSVKFEQGKIADLGEINLGTQFTDDPSHPDMSPIKYMTASAGATKPVTIAVIPDGFTAAEMSKYELLAKSAINTLFEVEPYKSYKTYFNVYILKVASNESGANITDGNGTITTPRNCYFGSKWGASSYGDMKADESKIRSFVTDNCPDIKDEPHTHTIEDVPILMIINDERYGGICHTSSVGFSYGMVPYTYGGGRITWSYPDLEADNDSETYTSENLKYKAVPDEKKDALGRNGGNWLNTMVHEFGGHCFARLTDEYWGNGGKYTYISGPVPGQSYPVPFGLNVSATHNNPGWQHLLDKKANSTLGAPYSERIGTFQGGDTYTWGRWRSEQISCMIDNRFYFSTFQRELIVRRIMTLAGESFNESSFWEKDVATDPVRDNISSAVMGSDPVMPRPVPLLPPPVLHTDW